DLVRPMGVLLQGLVADLRGLATVDELSRLQALARYTPASPSTVALIQYTSGSTGGPKGVVLTHANLLANIRAMGKAMQASSRDVFASWLPLYHDMGLIGAWLSCLYYGALSAVMPPLVFLANPARWLWSIHRHRATMTRIPLRIEGAALPSGAVMIVSNHSSYLDGLVLSAALDRELTFIAKQELEHQLIAGPFLKRLGTIFVHRLDPREGAKDAETILSAAREGATLVTMPEGTFSRMPGLLPFRLGAFLVATKASMPVAPVTIRGTRMVLRSDQWLPRQGEISVHIADPIRADGSDFGAAARLRDRCRDIILRMSGEPDLAQ